MCLCALHLVSHLWESHRSERSLFFWWLHNSSPVFCVVVLLDRRVPLFSPCLVTDILCSHMLHHDHISSYSVPWSLLSRCLLLLKCSWLPCLVCPFTSRWFFFFFFKLCLWDLCGPKENTDFYQANRSVKGWQLLCSHGQGILYTRATLFFFPLWFLTKFWWCLCSWSCWEGSRIRG